MQLVIKDISFIRIIPGQRAGRLGVLRRATQEQLASPFLPIFQSFCVLRRYSW